MRRTILCNEGTDASLNVTITVANLPPDVSTMSNLLYVVAGGVLGIAGSIISAYFSRGWRREDELTGAIYEPMLSQLLLFLQEVERGDRPGVDELLRLGMDPKTQRIDAKVLEAARNFYGFIKLYPLAYDAAKGEADRISGEEIGKYLETHTEDVGQATLREFHLGKHDLICRAFFGAQLAGEVTLCRCLLLDKHPFDVLLEECSTLFNAKIDCLVAGQSFETKFCNEIVKSGQEAARRNDKIQTFRAMRELLMDENRSPAKPLSDLLRRRVGHTWPWRRLIS